MSEHPILFSSEMVRAILEGRKTQTRRIMKPQPTCAGASEITPAGDMVYLWPTDDGKTYYSKCPYGVPGDQLWARETWRETFDIDEIPVMEYRAGGTRIIDGKTIRHGQHRITSVLPKWRPSIFMPRWASRIRLEITNVRIERLLDISRDDAFREGIVPINPYKLPSMADVKTPLPAAFPDYQDADNCFFGDPIPSYYSLWDSINSSKGYLAQENPWVWVIEFKTI